MKNDRPLIAIGIELDWPLQHHYDLLAAILKAAKKTNWVCRIESGLESSDRIEQLPDNYDGVIARLTPALADCCRRSNVPVVNVWANSPVKNAVKVFQDETQTGIAAANYFLQRGFRNFGVIQRLDDKRAEYMLKIVEKVVHENGGEVAPWFVSLIPVQMDDWNSYRKQMADWIDGLQLPSAVFASDHIMARHFVQQCLDRGLWIPDDVAVISGMDSSFVCAGMEPTITALKFDYEKIGEVIVETMARMIGGDSAAVRSVAVGGAVTINERRSTDVHAVDDRTVARALRYVWDNGPLPISVEDVVDALQVTRRWLERRFRDELGQSINDVITETRMSRAKRILRDTDEKIYAVAKDAGFSNAQHMARVFAKKAGISPTEYRASAQRRNDHS